MLIRNPRSILLKEIYRSGRERISFLLNLFGNVQPDTATNILSNESWQRSEQVLKAILDSMQADPSQDYGTAIKKVASWCLTAHNMAFQDLCVRDSKSAPYAIRKGLEFVQVVLFRDLRRNTMESEESRRYHIFLNLVATFPRFSEANDIQKRDVISS